VSAGVVIAGGGLAGQRCAETLRRNGYDGPVRMICAEPHRPYDRPPLSKELLLGGEADGLPALRPAEWYTRHDVELLLGVRATRLDPHTRTLTLSDGTHARYARLLIATGSRPRTLPGLEGHGNVTTLRTVEDAGSLRTAIARRARLAVIGAGFIGQEVAATARTGGCEVTLVEAAPLPLGNVLGRELGHWFAELHRDEGVRVVLNRRIVGVEGEGRVGALRLDDGARVECDHVVVAIAVTPDLAWLQRSGLDPAAAAIDGQGRTAAAGVFAAGDAAAVFDPHVRRHVPGGHWESAARQGAQAAKAMLGLRAAPIQPHSFWSDQYGTRIQQVGHAGLADRISIDGDPAARDFTALYTRADRPVAALLVGRPHALPEVRRLITTPMEMTA
jgi:3-phenylpropionate/trans-cinnamate dioxygenase ferredoxin reductase component